MHSDDVPDPQTVERAFRELLDEHGLPAPDEVRPHGPGELLFLWHERRLAVVVELEEPHAAGAAG